MSVTLHKDTAEWVLDQEYEINFVFLTETEKCHTHRFIELVYTTQGRGLHRIDEKEYHVQSGDLLLINYNSRHSVQPVENLHYVDIMLKPEYVSETLRGTEDLFLILQLRDFSDLSGHVLPENVLLHFEGEERKKIEFLLDWTKEEQKKDAPAAELIRHSALTMLLSLVFRKMTELQNTRLSVNDVLLSYIRENCGSRLPIHEIAGKCGYTPEHFSRIFKKYTGKNPVEYIHACRLEKAAHLLRQSGKSVETILGECGFTNRTAFFRIFSRTYGCTPLQYRKNQK